ncbi:MAG: TetR/AcrR family transcriptional regulator [Candidatus Binatia bacterium]
MKMGARRAGKAVSDIYDESIPAWQRQSIRRSLQSAHARAHVRSNRFVTAATQLLQERGNADFTVQEVVERSRMSIRTFYTYFASKEDLLVAVSETAIAREAVPRLRKRIEKQKDPLLRLRAYVEGVIELTGQTDPAAWTLTSFHNRLAETRPADLERVMKPQFDLLAELVRDVARTRPLRRDLTSETAAQLTHHQVTAAANARALGSRRALDIPARTIWEFCASGMGLPAGSSLSGSRQ